MGPSRLATPCFLFTVGCTPPAVLSEEDSAATALQERVEEVDIRLHDTITSVAVLSWTQLVDGDTWVEYGLPEESWLSSPRISRGAGSWEELLLGIPYDSDFSWRLMVDKGWGGEPVAQGSFSTGVLPTGFPEADLLSADPMRWESGGRWLLGSVNGTVGGWVGGTYWAFILDRHGRAVWARRTPRQRWTIFVGLSGDGSSILVDEATYWSDMDSGAGSMVYALGIDGEVRESYETPGLHHGFTALPDGSLAWGAATPASCGRYFGVDEELRIRAPSGEVTTLWTCSDFSPTFAHDCYCQSNTISWHEPSGSFLYSFFTMETVVELDGATGESRRYWGNLPGSWDFDPPHSRFYWQHGATFTDEGTLLLSTHVDDRSAETVVREYELDEAAQTLRQVWSFGEGEGLHAYTAGEAHRLPGGNTLHNYGSAGRLREVTPEGEVVWDLSWQAERLLGRAIFLEDLYALAP